MILPKRFAAGYDSMPLSLQQIEATAVILNGTDGMNITLPRTIAGGGEVKTGVIYLAGFNHLTLIMKGGPYNVGVNAVLIDATDNSTELYEIPMGSTTVWTEIARIEKELHGIHTIKLKFFNTDATNPTYIEYLYGLYLATI